PLVAPLDRCKPAHLGVLGVAPRSRSFATLAATLSPPSPDLLGFRGLAMADTINDNRSSPDFAGQVNRMFDRVAGHYDTLNSVMTAGLHHRWREGAAGAHGLGPGEWARDFACGPGALPFELAGRVAPEGRVVGCDFPEPMLDLAREKA